MKQSCYSAATKRDARRLYASGLSCRAVAEHLNCSPASVWRWIGGDARNWIVAAAQNRSKLTLSPGARSFLSGLRLAGARIGADCRLRYTVPRRAAAWAPQLVAQLREFGIHCTLTGRSLRSRSYPVLGIERWTTPDFTPKSIVVWLWAATAVQQRYVRAHCTHAQSVAGYLQRQYAMRPRINGKRVVLSRRADTRQLRALVGNFAPPHVRAWLARLD